MCSFRKSMLVPAQVVFWDLRQELLEGLYRHNVGEARLQPMLDILDATLGGLVEASVPVRQGLLESSPFTQQQHPCVTLHATLGRLVEAFEPVRDLSTSCFWTHGPATGHCFRRHPRSAAIARPRPVQPVPRNCCVSSLHSTHYRGCSRPWRAACWGRWRRRCGACTWMAGPHGDTCAAVITWHTPVTKRQTRGSKDAACWHATRLGSL
jgi:hypothetical protein